MPETDLSRAPDQGSRVTQRRELARTIRYGLSTIRFGLRETISAIWAWLRLTLG